MEEENGFNDFIKDWVEGWARPADPPSISLCSKQFLCGIGAYIANVYPALKAVTSTRDQLVYYSSHNF